MLFTPDMRELLRLFGEHNVEYCLVGGFAVNYYGYVRTTQDIDLLVHPTQENSSRVMAALADFGFGSAGIPEGLFEQEGSAIHLGNEPNRIDLLTSLRGVSNRAVFDATQQIELEGVTVNIISLRHLLEAKRNSDRARDRADVDELLKINEQP